MERQSQLLLLFPLLLVSLLFDPSAALPNVLDASELLRLQAASTSVSSWSDRNAADWSWERTGFHFQPAKNWMNDPNGPLVYKGIYHLFYQYNPRAAVWGNITWGHAVSPDLVHWSYLDATLVPDKWYDINGVWSGSATLVQGKPVLFYTGVTSESAQVQNLAAPVNDADPLLRRWVKLDSVNPVAVAPAGVNDSKFRDPTTAWLGPDGKWRIAVGAKHDDRDTGIILQYKSADLARSRWELVPKLLHSGAGSGMWECPDFYPVQIDGKNGVSEYDRKDAKYVVKVSLDEKRWDAYVVGTYDRLDETFVPSDPALDIGNAAAFRYDYGIYYASKTFYDEMKQRRVLLGWISEADTPASDIAKGWASLQAMPRQIWLDSVTQKSLLQWPVHEVEKLRQDHLVRNDLLLDSYKTLNMPFGDTSQVDIEVTFEVPDMHFDENAVLEGIPTDMFSYCNETIPSAEKVLGPFGLHVLASSDLRERTSIFFKLFKFKSGWKTAVCSDLTSSSLASDVTKAVYGGLLTRGGHKLSLRVLVDHSIVETFAQRGQTCITSRSYPLLGESNVAQIFLFNNGTLPVRVTEFKAWHMSRIHIPTLA